MNINAKKCFIGVLISILIVLNAANAQDDMYVVAVEANNGLPTVACFPVSRPVDVFVDDVFLYKQSSTFFSGREEFRQGLIHFFENLLMKNMDVASTSSLWLKNINNISASALVAVAIDSSELFVSQGSGFIVLLDNIPPEKTIKPLVDLFRLGKPRLMNATPETLAQGFEDYFQVYDAEVCHLPQTNLFIVYTNEDLVKVLKGSVMIEGIGEER